MRSELITDQHLARCAVIYVRQSSPHQVLTNQESLRLQYDLRQRALGLGWREEDIEVIDADLGLSGAAATHREGFKELIALADDCGVAACRSDLNASGDACLTNSTPRSSKTSPRSSRR